MINRVLIRIKVIQLLYSYLLIEKHFMLESQPASPNTESRFAYNLYLDLLVLMVKISRNVEQRGGNRPLEHTKFIARISADDKVKALLRKYLVESYPYERVVGSLADEIKESSVYKNFLKENDVDSVSERFWETVFNTMILRNSTLNSLISQQPRYSMRSLDRVKNMFDTTFTNFYASADNPADAVKQLNFSLNKARDLYFLFMTLPVELADLQSRLLDERRHKYITTDEDLNPNMRFVENQLVSIIRSNDEINAYLSERKIGWTSGNDDIMLRNLLKEITASDIYKEYMEFPASDLKTDCEFWRNIFKHVIFTSDDFLEALEDKSVFWNDDIEIMGTFMLKSFRRFEEGDIQHAVLPMYKDDEDSRFGRELMSEVIKNKDTYRAMIDSALDTRMWDSDRLAFMDVVVMMTALAEIINFPKIPLTVSLNEYIEIAKSYSTAKSGVFINALLGKIVAGLKERGEITK